MVRCPACEKDVNPISELNESMAIVNTCPNQDCKAVLGRATPAHATPPNLSNEQPGIHPGTPENDAPVGATRVLGRLRTPPEPIDLVASARERLKSIDMQLETLKGLQRERRKLAAMIAAADAADDDELALPHAAE